MGTGVSGKIDVMKIEKERLFIGKNGAKYLDFTFFLNDEPDQYGNNGMITQDVSKEEREQGVKGPILGNVKIFYRENQSQPNQNQSQPQGQGYQGNQGGNYQGNQGGGQQIPDDDIPF